MAPDFSVKGYESIAGCHRRLRVQCDCPKSLNRSLDDPHTLRSLRDVRGAVTDLVTKSDREAGSGEN